MKPGDSFQLSYFWWKSEKADTLRKSGLGKALKAYENAYQSFKKDPSINGYEVVITALGRVDVQRKNAIQLCIKFVHTETQAALEKDGIMDQTRRILAREAMKGVNKQFEEVGLILDAMEPKVKNFQNKLDACEELLDKDPGKGKTKVRETRNDLVDLYNNRDSVTEFEKGLIPLKSVMNEELPKAAAALKELTARRQKVESNFKDFETQMRALEKRA